MLSYDQFWKAMPTVDRRQAVAAVWTAKLPRCGLPKTLTLESKVVLPNETCCASRAGRIMEVTKVSSMSSLADPSVTFAHAEHEYREAWNDPSHTRFELPPANVNKLLKDCYRVMPDKPVTRSMIWDMETKKAWDPLSYIPYVVSEGHSWGRTKLQDGSARFSRSSLQRGWIAPEEGRVLEDVFVSPDQQTIFFLGRERMSDANGNELKASKFQPIFHVKHGVGGSEEEPLNLWSIVLLTPQPDVRYLAPFEQMVKEGLLPGFIEIYIRKDLGRQLART